MREEVADEVPRKKDNKPMTTMSVGARERDGIERYGIERYGIEYCKICLDGARECYDIVQCVRMVSATTFVGQQSVLDERVPQSDVGWIVFDLFSRVYI